MLLAYIYFEIAVTCLKMDFNHMPLWVLIEKYCTLILTTGKYTEQLLSYKW